MKKIMYVVGAALGVGVVLYVVKMFTKKPGAQASQVANTNSAGALDPFYRLFGLTQTPKSTGQGADNTGQLIVAGGNAFTSTVKSLTDLLKGTPMTTPVAATATGNIGGVDIYQTFDPTVNTPDWMTGLTDSQLLYGVNLEKP